MKPSLKVLSGVLLLAIASLIGLWKITLVKQPDSAATHDFKSSKPVGLRQSSVGSAFPNARASPVPAADDTRANSAAPDDGHSATRDAAMEKIHDAATTYDPAELTVIQPYLVSADPKIRQAAVEGMVVLGDPAAGSMLRDAAARMESNEEAKSMLSAADYVELPPAKLRELTKRHEGSTEVVRRQKKKK